MENKTIFQRIFKKSSSITQKLEANKEEEILILKRSLDEMKEEIEVMGSMDIEVKSLESSGSAPNYMFTHGRTDPMSLQKLFMTEGWLYITVSTIAYTIASLPLKVEKEVRTMEQVEGPLGVVESVPVVTWVDATGEPEQELFDFPNDLQAAMEYYLLIYSDLLGTGDAYIYIDQGQGSTPISRPGEKGMSKKGVGQKAIQGLYRLNPALVQPMPATQGRYIGFYNYNSPFGAFKFLPEEVIHIKMPNPADPFHGMAPIVPVLKSLLLDRYTSEHMIRFYKQGARLGGVVEADKKLTPAQITRLQRSFENNYTGKKNHHKTLILPNGMKYKTIEQNPGETELIAFSKANREPILSAYGVPPMKVGLLDGASYANALIQNKTYFIDTVKPLLTLIEQHLNVNAKILPDGRKLRVRYDLSQVEALQENLKEKADIGVAMLKAGLSVNEVRQELWKKPKEEGGSICVRFLMIG